MQVWPAHRFRPVDWLSNFQDEELSLALTLLENFIFFSDRLTSQLFATAFQSLSERFARTSSPRRAWQRFQQSLIMTPVVGEEPSVADSGNLFARVARDALGISEDQLCPLNEALERATSSSEPTNVVLIDDFIGSGDQTIKTWQRKSKALGVCLRDLSERGLARVYYVCVVATRSAIGRIRAAAPALEICPAHALGERHCATIWNAGFWPLDQVPLAETFLQETAFRGSISMEDPYFAPYGYKDLALAIAFEHGTPDATLPHYRFSGPNWRPLLRSRI